MIKNYFKIAWRNLMRHKSYAVINIMGLAVGIAACLLIFTVVSYEFSFDKFRQNYDHIYRVVTNTKYSDGNSIDYNRGIAIPALDALKTDFPQLKKIAGINSIFPSQVTVLGDDPNSDAAQSKKFIEGNDNVNGVIFAEPTYFDIIKASWLAGDAKVLSDPSGAVLDKKMAAKYFGTWEDAMGKFLKIDNTILVKVGGVVEEVPANSDFPVSVFLSYEAYKKSGDTYNYNTDWGSVSSSHQVYVEMPENLSAAKLQAQLNAFTKKHFSPDPQSKKELLFQPLKDLHFDANYGSMGPGTSNKNTLWTLAFIGLLIIIMASINFINLSTAQAVGRSREVGIRKVLGSSRTQLVGQVIGETFLVVLFSTLLAILIAKISLPYLSNVASVPASISLFSASSITFIIGVLAFVTILAGSYPAMIVSGFKPVLALKSKINSANIGGISLRRVLVITQFSISQILVIATIIAVSQMNFVRNADLGLNKEAVLVMPAYSDSANRARMAPFKQQLLQNPNVINVSFASDEPSSDNNWSGNFSFNHGADESFPMSFKYADEHYMKTYGLTLLAGRNYSRSDTVKEIVVNETLVKKLGLKDPKQILGKDIRIGRGQWLPIVGVVKDFRTNSLREETKPIYMAPRQAVYFTVAVKLRTTELAKTTAEVQRLWESTYPEYAMTSHFTDETIDRFYRQETQLSLLYKLFAGIAIFISCLGLYGLVSYMAVQKTKEVGIRKVLGASVGSIIVMFSREFTLLIGIAFIIAVPVSWYFMNDWLQNFVYKIDIGISVFAIAIATSLIIAWITVGYRAVRAAMTNPVKSLRSE